jgi:hypothetical protein
MADIPRHIGEQPQAPQRITAVQAGGLQSSIAEAGAGLGDVTKELIERKAKLDNINNDTWLINFTNEYKRDARGFYTDAALKTGEDAKNNMENSAQFFKSYEDRIAKEAPNDVYANAARLQLSNLHNGYEDKLIVSQTMEIYKSNEKAYGDSIDEIGEEAYVLGGGVDMLDAAIEDNLSDDSELMVGYSDTFGADQAKRFREESIKFIANQTINRAIRDDPEGTLEDLEAGKYSKYLTTKERDEHIKNARAEKTYKKQQDRETQLEAQDQILAEIIKTPSMEAIQEAKDMLPFEGDSKGQSALASMESALIKTAKAEARAQSYVNAMTAMNTPGVDPREISDAELMVMVGGNLEDFTKLKSYKTDILQNPSADRTSYQFAVDDIKKDYEDGLYTPADGDEEQALIEYAKSLEGLRLWTLKNPDKNPLEYQRELKKNKSITGFQNFLNAIPVFNLFYEPTPETTPRDIRNIREEIEFELKQVPRMRRATARRLLSQSGRKPTSKLVAEQTERMAEIEDALIRRGLSYSEIYNLTLEQWLEADASLTAPGAPSGP